MRKIDGSAPQGVPEPWLPVRFQNGGVPVLVPLDVAAKSFV
jgi:hypothetical protein